MRILSVVQQKGGEGKTTVAVNLAAALASSGSRTLLVDVDPQQSATWWYEHGPGFAFELVADADPRNLARLRDLDVDVIVIDTPGSLANVPVLSTVLQVSDFAILPSKPTALAVTPLTRTLNDHVIPAEVPYRVLANRVDPRVVDPTTGVPRGARELYDLLDDAGYAHFRTYLRNYTVWETAAAEGCAITDLPPALSRAASKAKDDLTALTTELLTIWANQREGARR